MIIEVTWFLEVGILLVVAKLLEGVAEKLGQPKVFAWVLVALVIPFTGYNLSEMTISLGILGIIMYLFYIGLEGSLRGFIRELKEAGLIALGGVLFSMAVSLAAFIPMGIGFREAFSLGVALSATSVSITVKTLEDLGKIRRREAQAILGAAVVDDVLGLALLSTLLGLSAENIYEISISVAEITLLAFVVWFAIAFTIRGGAKPLYRYFARFSGEGPILTLTFVLLLVLAYIADILKLSSILLAYAFGLGLSSHTYIAHKAQRLMRPLIVLFTPLFFIVAGSRFTLGQLMSVNFMKSSLIISSIIVAGFLTKVLGCYIPAKLLGFGHRESMIIGFGMVPRGEVMMTAALAARAAGLLSTPTYVSIVLLLPITSLITPPILSKLYSGVK